MTQYTRRNWKMEIAEEQFNKETGGHYASEGIVFTAPANQTTIYDIAPKIPVALLSAQLHAKGLNDGDQVRLEVGPETIVGGISSNVSASDTTINIPQSVCDLFDSKTLFTGMGLFLYDGTNKDDCGIIENYDSQNKTITTSIAATNNFSASTPTYLKVTASMTPSILSSGYVELTGSNHSIYTFGEDKIGGSYISAGKIIRVIYVNNDAALDANVRVNFGYLY